MRKKALTTRSALANAGDSIRRGELSDHAQSYCSERGAYCYSRLSFGDLFSRFAAKCTGVLWSRTVGHWCSHRLHHGSKPYGYVGLGDISVFTFFGLLGVLGTYFLHTGTLSVVTVLPAIGCGLLSVAVLNVNNMRDIENDAECGKRTVAVRLGLGGAKRYHYVLVVTGIASLMITNLLMATPFWLLAGWLLALLVTKGHLAIVQQAKEPKELAPQLPQMVKCALVSNLVFVLLTIFTLIVS